MPSSDFTNISELDFISLTWIANNGWNIINMRVLTLGWWREEQKAEEVAEVEGIGTKNKSGFIQNEATKGFQKRSETGDNFFWRDKQFCHTRFWTDK